MQIRMLDAATIGRIAAGEVVERPLSVVKELVENSIDAKATAITVEIREGGSSYIRVTDNGIGIPIDEAALAFENHATSKFTDVSDLYNIATLGFRGEALPSIAAVSDVTMETCQHGQELGAKINVKAGKVEDFLECPLPTGTSVVVRDLFYNLPARRAFLKRKATETALITEMMMKIMVGMPEVAFRFISNNRTLYQTFGDGKMLSAALNVFGLETAEKLIEVDEAEGDIRIRGWIGVGDCAKATRSMQAFFINGRIVRCQMLSNALDESAHDRVMIGSHPICALHITLPPDSVDINVHPSKLEVRFRDEDKVYQEMLALFERGLRPKGMLNLKELIKPVPNIRPKSTISYAEMSSLEDIQTEVLKKQTEVQNSKTGVDFSTYDAAIESEQLTEKHPIDEEYRTIPQHQGEYRISHQYTGSVLREDVSLKYGEDDDDPDTYPAIRRYRQKPEITQVVRADVEDDDECDPLLPQLPMPKFDLPFKVIGVVFQTYVIVEFDDMMLLIDQHAAHERLLYEHYNKIIADQTVSQQLLVPIILEVSSTEMALINDNNYMLRGLGFELQPFGDRTIQIRAVPQILGKTENLQATMMGMIEELGQLKTNIEAQRRKRIIMMACKRAVKAGDKLDDFEIAQLLIDMIDSDAAPTCPHGRPVMHIMNKTAIERLFKRT